MLLAITAPAATKAQSADPLAGFDWSVESYRLENGLTVLLSPDHTLPHVALNIWYRVGPADDPAGKSGLAHLFEHLMFGPSARSAEAVGQRLEQLGASNVNGNTGWDYTSYFETFPSDRLAQALWLERERMAVLGKAITARRLTQQIEIVKHERSELHTASPYARSDLLLWRSLFGPEHAYHAGILGTSAGLASITLRDAREFFAAHYRASNATLALVGDFEPGQAKALIATYFGSLPRHARAHSAAMPSPPGAAVGRRLEVIEPGQPERVVLGWQTPPAYSEADVALAVALGVLCSGKASRLRSYLIERSELAASVEASLDSNRLGSVASIGAVVREGGELRALQFGIEREIELLALDGPFEQELERAKRMILVRALDDVQRFNGSSGASGRSGLLQRFQLHVGAADYLATWVSMLQQVSADDVRRVTRAHLPVASATIVLSRSHAAASTPEGATP
jgi:zinc protease